MQRSWFVKSLNRLAEWKAPQSGGETFSKRFKAIRRSDAVNRSIPAPFLESLDVLLRGIDESDSFHPFGAFYVTQWLTGLLKSQIKTRAHIDRCGATSLPPIRKPVFIIGLPRSGTSFLVNLLSQDPRFRTLRNWETVLPQVPIHPRLPPILDPRRMAGAALLRLQNHLAPSLKFIHQFHLDGPEECTPLLMQTFSTQAMGPMFRSSRYDQWLDHVDYEPHYRLHQAQLQILEPRMEGRRWLLKAPGHLPAVASILKVYPDAVFIHTHRRLFPLVLSFANLNRHFRGIYAADDAPAACAQASLHRLSADMKRYLKVRGRVPVIDVDYHDLVADPQRIVRRLYERLNLAWDEGTGSRLSTFLREDRDVPRRHVSNAAIFDLREDDVIKEFNEYVDLFPHVAEGAAHAAVRSY